MNYQTRFFLFLFFSCSSCFFFFFFFCCCCWCVVVVVVVLLLLLLLLLLLRWFSTANYTLSLFVAAFFCSTLMSTIGLPVIIDANAGVLLTDVAGIPLSELLFYFQPIVLLILPLVDMGACLPYIDITDSRKSAPAPGIAL